MKIEIYNFSCPARGCCDNVVIFLAAGIPLAAVYLLLARDLGWRLGTYIRMDHQVLVV
jgi:hypothetical protein